MLPGANKHFRQFPQLSIRDICRSRQLCRLPVTCLFLRSGWGLFVSVIV